MSLIFSIEPYQNHYKTQIIDLILTIQIKEFGISISREDQPDLEDIQKFYQRGNGQFWVTLLDNQVIGTLGLIDIGNQQVAARKMFVSQKYRGKVSGIAKSLLETAIDWCKKRKVHVIYLGTTSSYHAAHRFYEKHGFSEIQKSDLPQNFQVMEVDTKFYKFIISNNEENNVKKINLAEKFQKFNDYWSPKIVGDLNDSYVKLAKFKGEFVWHKHDNEDELFLVIKGHLLLKLRDRDIHLEAGEFTIIPKGVEHLPIASEEAHILLIEPKATLNTGDVINEKTKEYLDWI